MMRFIFLLPDTANAEVCHMKILLIDDHVLFREGLASLLTQQPNIEVVGMAKTKEEAIAAAKRLQPDVILMDYRLPDGTGAEAARAILSENPDFKIVFLTIHEDDEILFESIRSGAKGYLLKNTSVSKLITYLFGIERGEAAITPQMTTRILEEFTNMEPMHAPMQAEAARLTPRERQVLQELDKGATNQEIAARLFISERTVKNHVSRILAKLDLKNRYEAANFARRHGLTSR